MPRVDGLTFLDRLMKAKPTPVVMISTLTEERADATLRALELGAVDYIAKPKVSVSEGMQAYRDLIIDKIKVAAHARIRQYRLPVSHQPLNFTTTEKIIAIGASTGGTEAIKSLLLQLPPNSPGIVITQHMPPGFTRTFANRLNGICAMEVSEAQGGERLLPGTAYIAPGHKHLRVVRSGSDYRLQLDDGPLVSGHKPSVDVMFQSLAECAGANVLAVILTGMGKDGAQGMANLHAQRAVTFAQDQQSCVVFGMPKVAIELNAVDFVCGIDEMGARIIEQLKLMKAGSRL